MARKVFISVLGAGFYEECCYKQGTFTSQRTRFIQEAMAECYGISGWNADDAAYILLTEKAREVNWSPNSPKRINTKTKQEETYTGLRTRLENQGINVVKELDIPDGKNSDEMWRIFQIVFDQLKDKDELYVDLTHSFRYLPMLVLVLCNYAKFLKRVRVMAITYGNYEAHNENNIAPIVDLLPISKLQDWTFAAADFIQNGNVDRLSKLSNSEYVKKLAIFIDQMRFCRGKDIYTLDALIDADGINDDLSASLPPLLPVVKKIEDTMKAFQNPYDAKNCITAAEWCFRKKQYQASITMLQEGIATFFCEYLKKCGYLENEDVCNEHFRKVVKGAIVKKTKRNYTPEGNLTLEEVDAVAERINITDEFSNAYRELTRIRNDFNHAGMGDSPYNIEDLKAKIQSSIDKIRNVLSSYK